MFIAEVEAVDKKTAAGAEEPILSSLSESSQQVVSVQDDVEKHSVESRENQDDDRGSSSDSDSGDDGIEQIFLTSNKGPDNDNNTDQPLVEQISSSSNEDNLKNVSDSEQKAPDDSPVDDVDNVPAD